VKGRAFIYPFTPSGFAAGHERLASLQRQVLSLRCELADLKRERDALRAGVDRLRQGVATRGPASEKR
jgi:cell division protein FtsB